MIVKYVCKLQVENILVVGHSRCGGIRALMTMDDDETEEDIDSRFLLKFSLLFFTFLTMHIHHHLH